MPTRTPVIERLLAFVVAGPNNCWIYTGTVARDGYGHISDPEGKPIKMAHRVTYEHFVGPVPGGLQLDHICRIRRCVNPKHLEAVTARENTRRSPISPSAVNARKTHCDHGHELTPENTYDYHGRRKCKECNRRRQREFRRKRADEFLAMGLTSKGNVRQRNRRRPEVAA